MKLGAGGHAGRVHSGDHRDAGLGCGLVGIRMIWIGIALLTLSAVLFAVVGISAVAAIAASADRDDDLYGDGQ